MVSWLETALGLGAKYYGTRIIDAIANGTLGADANLYQAARFAVAFYLDLPEAEITSEIISEHSEIFVPGFEAPYIEKIFIPTLLLRLNKWLDKGHAIDFTSIIGDDEFSLVSDDYTLVLSETANARCTEEVLAAPERYEIFHDFAHLRPYMNERQLASLNHILERNEDLLHSRSHIMGC